MTELGKELTPFVARLSPQTGAMIIALSDGQAGRVLKAAFRYFSAGREPRLDPVSLAAFEAIKRDVEQDGIGGQE